MTWNSQAGEVPLFHDSYKEVRLLNYVSMITQVSGGL